jgi:trimeric autotransporter adhesin
MLKLSSRHAALVLTGATLALAAGVLPAQAASTASTASTGWRTAATVASKGKTVVLSGIDAVSARDAWAAGAGFTSSGKNDVGLIEHWAGKAWQAVKLPSSIAKDWNAYAADFPLIGASSATDVWAFGDTPSGTEYDGYVRLNGRKWTAGKLPDSSISGGKAVLVAAVKVISSTDVWVLGGQTSASSATSTFTPYAAQFNGSKWKTYSVPGSGVITAASEISRGDIWAVLGVPSLYTSVATAASPAVVQWNGSSWKTTAVQPSAGDLPSGANLTSIIASSNGTVWIGGGAANSKGGTSEFAAKLTGSTWTKGSLSASASSSDFSLISLVPDGSGGVWGLAETNELNKPRIWHLASGATTWKSAATSLGSSNRALLQLAQVPGTHSAWGVGVVQRGKAVDGLFAVDGATPR